jgi:predicted RNA-binding protein with PIN domain
MSLLSKISGLFKSGPSAGGSSKDRTYIVDGVALLDPRGNGSRISPRDMIGILHRLSRFALTEKIQVQVLFQGEPLRKAPEGEGFNGLEVFYAESDQTRPDRLMDLLKQGLKKSGGVTVITSGGELERKIMEAGGHVMRSITFRKALDTGDGGGMDRDRDRDRDRMRDRRRRPFRRGPDEGGGGGGGGGGSPEGGEPAAQGSGQGGSEPKPQQGGGDSVRNLIDLVE